MGHVVAGAGILDVSKVEEGVSADEIVALALANIGQSWQGDAAGFAWGVSNLAGLPFFDLHDRTAGPANQPLDTSFASPNHYWSNTQGDGWATISTNNSVSDLAGILRPGDIVRVYDNDGNHHHHHHSEDDGHTFIVVSTAGGSIEVVDNWSGDDKIVRHNFSDIVDQMANCGRFESAYVSRIIDDFVDHNVPDTLQGRGYGDWSGIGVDLEISAAPTLTVAWANGVGTVTGSYEVHNVGTVDAHPSWTGVYLSTDSTIDSTDQLLTIDYIASCIAAGGSRTQGGSFALPAGLKAGTYYIGVIADYDDCIGELNENNNASPGVKISIGADLKIPTAPTVTWTGTGGVFNYSYTVANAGVIEAAASKTGIYLSNDSTITAGDTLLTTDDVAKLLAGGSSAESGSFVLPAGLAAGTYYIGAIADKENAILNELDESNNASPGIKVVIASDFKIATAPTVTWTGTGGTFDFSYNIDNVGMVAAGASKTGVYLSLDNTITTADTLLTTDDVASLLAGGSKTETGSFVLPAGLAAGTYYIGAAADRTGLVGELNENNNASPGVKVVIASDLKIATAPTVTWTGTGGTFDFSYKIDNVGMVGAAASKTGIYLSTDSTITSGDTLLKTDDVASLLAGGSKTETGSFVLPAGLAAGTYYIGAAADRTGLVDELNESNNASPGVKVTIASDLKIASHAPTFSWSGTGGSFNFTYKVGNVGMVAAVSSKSGIYLSTDNVITASDQLIATDDVAGLLAGASRTEGGTFTLPINVPAGTYYVGVLADYNDAVVELRNSNNASTGIAVTIGSDLKVTKAPTLKAAWAGAGETFSLTYGLSNLGPTPAGAHKTGIYLSTDSTITSADRLIAVDDVAKLLAGASRTESGDFILPSDVKAGTYYIGVIADYNKTVSELNESNNVSSAVRVTVFTNGDDKITVPTGERSWHGLGGNDTITGTTSRDALYGDAGNDSLVGSNGDDSLIGGAGHDNLVGNGGHDYFQFDSVGDIGKTAGNRDIIQDWDAANDYIDLRGIDANSTTSADNAFSFVVDPGTTFSGAKGELRWVQQDNAGTAHDVTLVMGDVNGDKVADFVLELTGLHGMRAVDFLL